VRNCSFTGRNINNNMSVLAKQLWNLRIATCHAKKSTAVLTSISQDDVEFAKEYSELPGPKSLPLLGNNWRFLSFIGKCISLVII